MTTLIHQSNSFNNLASKIFSALVRTKCLSAKKLHTTYKVFPPGERANTETCWERNGRKDWTKNFQNFRLNQNLILCCNPQTLILQHIPLKKPLKHSQVPNEVELPLRLHCSAQSHFTWDILPPSLTFISSQILAPVLAHPLKNYTAATKAPKTHTRLPRMVHWYQ